MGETTIFGCALVSDEKTEAYKRVLEAFLEAMFNKEPKVVVTDGDGAMREAIRSVFPGSIHRLCSWHLHQNACGLRKVYGLKRMWATAFFRDNFFAGVRTTSIYEGDTSKKEVLRSGVVGAACNRLNKAAHKNPHNFVKNIEAIHQLADQMERQDGVDVNIADISRVVCDPTIVKTKGHTIRTCSKFSTRDQLQTVEEEESSVESDGESRDVMGPLISKKSNKRMKHNDVVKVTNVEMRDCSRSMDHVNHMSHQNVNVNDGFRFIHNDLRYTGTYQYQPSMLPHFGHAQFSSRVHLMPQYPPMPVQQAFRNTAMLHEIHTFGSYDPQQLTTGVNEVQRKAGVGISFFNPRQN
ncbi:MULE transposase domain [Sesbania bispinosa]|nr:MULE transposase domain [Sesbania bispinosa]